MSHHHHHRHHGSHHLKTEHAKSGIVAVVDGVSLERGHDGIDTFSLRDPKTKKMVEQVSVPSNETAAILKQLREHPNDAHKILVDDPQAVPAASAPKAAAPAAPQVNAAIAKPTASADIQDVGQLAKDAGLKGTVSETGFQGGGINDGKVTVQTRAGETFSANMERGQVNAMTLVGPKGVIFSAQKVGPNIWAKYLGQR